METVLYGSPLIHGIMPQWRWLAVVAAVAGKIHWHSWLFISQLPKVLQLLRYIRWSFDHQQCDNQRDKAEQLHKDVRGWSGWNERLMGLKGRAVYMLRLLVICHLMVCQCLHLHTSNNGINRNMESRPKWKLWQVHGKDGWVRSTSLMWAGCLVYKRKGVLMWQELKWR